MIFAIVFSYDPLRVFTHFCLQQRGSACSDSTCKKKVVCLRICQVMFSLGYGIAIHWQSTIALAHKKHDLYSWAQFSNACVGCSISNLPLAELSPYLGKCGLRKRRLCGNRSAKTDQYDHPQANRWAYNRVSVGCLSKRREYSGRAQFDVDTRQLQFTRLKIARV
jgi:hypothetical protein